MFSEGSTKPTNVQAPPPQFTLLTPIIIRAIASCGQTLFPGDKKPCSPLIFILCQPCVACCITVLCLCPKGDWLARFLFAFTYVTHWNAFTDTDLMEIVYVWVYHYVLGLFYVSRSSCLCVCDQNLTTAIPEHNYCIYSFCILYHARLSASIALIWKVHIF